MNKMGRMDDFIPMKLRKKSILQNRDVMALLCGSRDVQYMLEILLLKRIFRHEAWLSSLLFRIGFEFSDIKIGR